VSPIDRPRVVFDCNVLLQAAARSTGPAAACVELAAKSQVTLYVSRAALQELRRILGYPEVQENFPELTEAVVDDFLQRLLFKSVFVRRVPHVFDYPRATQDEPYIDLAIANDDGYLVTRDKDLLTLMEGHSAICKEFRQQTHPLVVLDPPSFLKAIEERR
jgi:putative PIN family toxin of toxin-antitoxin system